MRRLANEVRSVQRMGRRIVRDATMRIRCVSTTLSAGRPEWLVDAPCQISRSDAVTFAELGLPPLLSAQFLSEANRLRATMPVTVGRWRWHVERRVGGEESRRLQQESGVGDRHHGPVLLP